MTPEKRVFQRKRFIPERLLEYGFQKSAEGFVYEAAFMGGDFRAVVAVSPKGIVSGTVIDEMNEEAYTQLRAEHLHNPYAQKVRGEYEALLQAIADACCTSVLFASDQANRITEQIFEQYGVSPDFPWGKSPHRSYGTFRHTDSGKWFALIMDIKWDALRKDKNKELVDVINLKVDPQARESLLATEGIYVGYHMNHQHWISVVLNDTLSDEAVMRLIERSFLRT